MSTLCEHPRRVFRALLSTLSMLDMKDGSRRQLTRTGTPSARPFFKESKDQSRVQSIQGLAPNSEKQ